MNAFQMRIHSRIRRLGRRTIRLFGGLEYRDAEYDFVYRNVVGEAKNILYVGAYKDLLPLEFARRGNTVTVIDLQKYPEQHPNLTVIQGNFLLNTLPDHIFDYVVLLSAIEHMGLGTYNAPVYDDGDFKAMAEAKRVLKPEGKIVLTFPFIGKKPLEPRFPGYYDLSRAQRLLEGVYILNEEYYIPDTAHFGKITNCLPATLDQVTKVMRYKSACSACYVISAVDCSPIRKSRQDS
jgi:SAM-dependent methyltransferase